VRVAKTASDSAMNNLFFMVLKAVDSPS